jgi:hypothetical protein
MTRRARDLAERSLQRLTRLLTIGGRACLEAPVTDPPAPAPLRVVAKRLTDRELMERISVELDALLERLVVMQWDVEEITRRRARPAADRETRH